MKLSKLIPETADGVKRVSLIRVDHVVKWLLKNQPNAMKDVMNKLGQKECKDAFADLSKATYLWE